MKYTGKMETGVGTTNSGRYSGKASLKCKYLTGNLNAWCKKELRQRLVAAMVLTCSRERRGPRRLENSKQGIRET